jgi:hypothetical protein
VSNMRSLRFLFVLLFAAFSGAALVLADAGALGQNANSSTTEEGMQDANMNANMSAPRRGRRRRPRTQIVNEIAVIAPAAQDDDSRGDLSGEKVDLSGTYNGNLSTAGGQDVGSGPATLTVSGETFTLTTEGGANHNGRIYAVLTRGEVSAALYFSNIQDPATNTPAVYNVRARKRGDSLTLWPAPQTKAKLTFRPRR